MYYDGSQVKAVDYNGGRTAKDIITFAMDKGKALALKRIGERSSSSSSSSSSSQSGGTGAVRVAPPSILSIAFVTRSQQYNATLLEIIIFCYGRWLAALSRHKLFFDWLYTALSIFYRITGSGRSPWARRALKCKIEHYPV
jgi:hypothetical protein